MGNTCLITSQQQPKERSHSLSRGRTLPAQTGTSYPLSPVAEIWWAEDPSLLLGNSLWGNSSNVRTDHLYRIWPSDERKLATYPVAFISQWLLQSSWLAPWNGAPAYYHYCNGSSRLSLNSGLYTTDNLNSWWWPWLYTYPQCCIWSPIHKCNPSLFCVECSCQEASTEGFYWSEGKMVASPIPLMLCPLNCHPG